MSRSLKRSVTVVATTLGLAMALAAPAAAATNRSASAMPTSSAAAAYWYWSHAGSYKLQEDCNAAGELGVNEGIYAAWRCQHNIPAGSWDLYAIFIA